MASAFHSALLADLEQDIDRFTASLLALADRLGLILEGLEADHISLRCHQNTTAERWKTGLTSCGKMFSENMINGRPICLFALDRPLQIGPLQIDVVELPWPGNKRYPHEGWEHIEIVLRGDPETVAARALSMMSDEGLSQQGISVKTSSPQGENERLPNPTLAVSDGQTTIKFHPWSLKEIVASEQR